MQDSCKGGRCHQPSLPNYNYERDGWFPNNPDCPNHVKGVPFSTAYAYPNAQGELTCPNCFFHSTIMQSVTTECSHLHACASCSNCYSNSNGHLEPNVAAPFTHRTSPRCMGFSPPLTLEENLRLSHFDVSSYQCTSSNQPCSKSLEDVNSESRTMTFPKECSKLNNQISPQLFANESQKAPFVTTKSRSEAFRSFNPLVSMPVSSSLQRLPVSTPDKTETLVSLEKPMKIDNQLQHLETSSTTSGSDQTSKEKPVSTAINRKRSAGNDVCEVCGDRASGYHYNSLTCEGCKGFFRRSISKKEKPRKCKFGGNCEMDTYTRRKCPDCRLKKCKSVGMLEECLLTEIQCQSKRRSRRQKTSNNSKKVRNGEITASKEAFDLSLTSQSSFQNPPLEVKKQAEMICSSSATEEDNLLQFVGQAFRAYRADPEIVKLWSSYLGDRGSQPQLCEMATVHVQVLVEFTKKLPGFTKMVAEDQISLLKGSVVEIMLLRNSRGYNLKKDIDFSFLVKDIGLHETTFRTLLDFFARVDNLKLDDIEYGLLAAIVLFDSDHSNSEDKERIDRYRDRYVSAMNSYCESKEPSRNQIFAKILNLITELRTLCHTHSKVVSNMREKEQLTPLLCEIWDLR